MEVESRIVSLGTGIECSVVFHGRPLGGRMTLEEIRCFCEAKGAAVRIESSAGTVTYSSSGIQIGATFFSWQDVRQVALASQQEALAKADKFVIRPKFGDEKEVSRATFEQLLKILNAAAQQP